MSDLDAIYNRLIKDGEQEKRPCKRSQRYAWRAVKTREAQMKRIPMWFASESAEAEFNELIKKNPFP